MLVMHGEIYLKWSIFTDISMLKEKEVQSLVQYTTIIIDSVMWFNTS